MMKMQAVAWPSQIVDVDVAPRRRNVVSRRRDPRHHPVRNSGYEPRIAVLVSGGGTNLQALIDAQNRGELAGGKIVRVISSSEQAFALQRAKFAGIQTQVLRPRDCGSLEAFDAALMSDLVTHRIDLIVLAGYLAIVGPQVLSQFEDRIINVHPSLLPSFGGKGFYGLRVHQAALDYGDKVTGATVHFVSQVVDGGKILLQKAVDVAEDDTAETLQRKVMEQAEWVLLPRAVAMLCRQIELERGNRNG